MNTRMLERLVLAAALVAGAAFAATRTDTDLVKAVRHEVLTYPHYTIWDDVSFRVADGKVELFGAVTQPFKKQDIERAIQRIPGVTSVAGQLEVLPLSREDDRLRLRLARAIYGDPALSRYGIMALPPIHIIVQNGHVTLDGVVNNTLEKTVAGMRAATAGLSFGSVTNNLQVESPPKKS